MTKKFFPAVKDVFISKHRPEKEYDGLILTVGFSPQPLILSISAFNPKRIAFLYTIEHIQDQTGYDNSRTDLLPIDEIDVKGIYDITWNFARDTWRDFNNIVVDITGGKAFMGAGGGTRGCCHPG